MQRNSIFVLAVLGILLQLTSCGGGSSNSNGVSVSAAVTRSDSFQPGEEVPLLIQTNNFTLAAPLNMRAQSLLRHESSEEHDHNEEEEHAHDGSSEHEHDAGHDHGSDKLNPDAREGHYHIYLNDAEGTDAHLTGWQNETTFKLPAEVEEGTHTLRIELRDNEHVRVGVETIVFFDVVPE